MNAEEAGIIGASGGADPAASAGSERGGSGLVAWVLVEGAWLLFTVSLTVFVAASLQSLGGPWAAAAAGAAMFSLHGLVGLHVLRAERTHLAAWLRMNRRAVVLGLAGGAGLLGFNALYGLALEGLGIASPDVVGMLRLALPGPLLYLWAGVLAPVVEELYFRGRLLAVLDDQAGRGWAGATTSVMFAAIHGIPAFLPALLVFGFVLLWLRRRSGGLVAPIIAHVINNAVALGTFGL